MNGILCLAGYENVQAPVSPKGVLLPAAPWCFHQRPGRPVGVLCIPWDCSSRWKVTREALSQGASVKGLQGTDASGPRE